MTSGAARGLLALGWADRRRPVTAGYLGYVDGSRARGASSARAATVRAADGGLARLARRHRPRRTRTCASRPMTASRSSGWLIPAERETRAAVILMHGFTLASPPWLAGFVPWLRRRYNVLQFDFRGHGSSDRRADHARDARAARRGRGGTLPRRAAGSGRSRSWASAWAARSRSWPRPTCRWRRSSPMPRSPTSSTRSGTGCGPRATRSQRLGAADHRRGLGAAGSARGCISPIDRVAQIAPARPAAHRAAGRSR